MWFMAYGLLLWAHMKLRLEQALRFAVWGGFAAVGFSETAADKTGDASGTEMVEMEKFQVEGVPVEKQMLPTSRPFQSVFGTNDNIVDVPRNVTIISRQQLNDISISDVRDFSKLTSSSYTTTNFGAPANPSIRGQSADMFINGVRSSITSNGNGIPLDFNAVESVNIVKGPATAVQGTSMYVGGFVDLVTKRPFFDGFKGSVSYTIGSYDVNRWTLDIGGPLSKTVAYRISYSGEDSEGYWYDWFKKTESLYGAVTWRPSDRYELFVNSTSYYGEYTENWGINRVTQDLIDNLNYVTGININNGAAAAPSDPQNSANVKGGDNTMAWGPTVKLDRRIRLLKPGNNSIARTFNLQAIQTLKLTPDTTLKNTTYASYTKRDTLSTYYYSEIIDPSFFAENRTEFIFERSQLSLNAGLDLRYQRTKAYDDYFFEPVNVWDLTKSHAYIDVYNSTYFQSGGKGFPVPGWPGRFAEPGVFNGDTNDSWGVTTGPFVQSTWKFNDQFSLVAGGRYDFLHAHVREPLLPPFPEATINVATPNVNGSLVFKPTPVSSVYFTYNYSENTSGAVGNGGGITGWNGAGTALDRENFKQPSELYEIGSKYSLMGNRLFLNVAAFDQKRTAKSTSSTTISEFRYKGFEAEMNFQPSKALFATLSYSYIDAKQTPPFQSDGGTGLLPTEGIDYSGERRVSGLPQHLINALVSYTFSNGLGLSANTLITSKINNNFAGTLVIPSQYSIDVSAFYSLKSWDLRLTVLNVTNEKNWAPPNAVYGNGSILALPGTEVQLTVKYKF